MVQDILSLQQLDADDRSLVACAWSAADRAYVPYSYFPVGVAILAKNEAGESKTFSGGNIQNQSWDVDCCAERAVAFTAFEQGYRTLQSICMVTIKNTGGAPCGLCRQVLLELAPQARLLCVQNQDSDVKVWTVRELLPESKVRKVLPVGELVDAERNLVSVALASAGNSSSPYTNISDGAAVLAKNSQGEEKIFVGVRIENGVYGGTISGARVAAHTAVAAGCKEFQAVAIYADGPQGTADGATARQHAQDFVNISGACLQTLRQFGLNTTVLNVSISKTMVGRSTIAELLPDSFGPAAVV